MDKPIKSPIESQAESSLQKPQRNLPHMYVVPDSTQNGMTLRQYAAIQIAAGLCSNPELAKQAPIALAKKTIRCVDAILEVLEN